MKRAIRTDPEIALKHPQSYDGRLRGRALPDAARMLTLAIEQGELEEKQVRTEQARKRARQEGTGLLGKERG